MSGCCPTCRQPWPDGESGADDDAAALRLACQLREIWVSVDDRIRETDAATLMGCAVKTLRNRRGAMDPTLPDHVKRHGHILYSVAAVAAWLKKA